MATIVGKSGVRTNIRGKTPKRATADDGKPREMEVICEGEKVYLHIHSPGNLTNGWAITISAQDLAAALKAGI
jgi:hypothetical protein